MTDFGCDVGLVRNEAVLSRGRGPGIHITPLLFFYVRVSTEVCRYLGSTRKGVTDTGCDLELVCNEAVLFGEGDLVPTWDPTHMTALFDIHTWYDIPGILQL